MEFNLEEINDLIMQILALKDNGAKALLLSNKIGKNARRIAYNISFNNVRNDTEKSNKICDVLNQVNKIIEDLINELDLEEVDEEKNKSSKRGIIW